MSDPQSQPAGPLRLSEVVSALSYALDITEGQPEGHAVRTCLIGMRIARDIYLSPKQRTSLFYALLLKDLGCSSNASKLAYLFGADDRTTKCDLKTTNWCNPTGRIAFVFRNAGAGGAQGGEAEESSGTRGAFYERGAGGCADGTGVG